MAAKSGHGFYDFVDGVLNAFRDSRARTFSVRPGLAVSSAETDRQGQLIGNAVPRWHAWGV
jgi:hypothetical protein